MFHVNAPTHVEGLQGRYRGQDSPNRVGDGQLDYRIRNVEVKGIFPLLTPACCDPPSNRYTTRSEHGGTTSSQPPPERPQS